MEITGTLEEPKKVPSIHEELNVVDADFLYSRANLYLDSLLPSVPSSFTHRTLLIGLK
jgi:hypothetical protein